MAESTARHIRALDGLRGLAVLIVVLLHLFGRGDHTVGNPLIRAVAVVISFGWTGVTLFFVLSGFLITGILWDTRGDTDRMRNFYLRRTLRIFPLYYGALLLILAVSSFHEQLFQTLRHAWIYLLYLQNVLPVSHPTEPISPYFRTGHFWSLAIEEQFYLIWPFLIFRMRTLKQVQRLCLLIVVASALYKAIGGILNPSFINMQGSLAAHAGSLALGGFIATCFRGLGWEKLKRMAPLALFASFAAYACTFLAPTHSRVSAQLPVALGLLLISIFWGALLILCLSNRFAQRVFEMTWLRWLGTISYGLYVYHELLLNLFMHIASRLSPHGSLHTYNLIKGFSGVVISLVVSTISFYLFEAPILRLKRSFYSPTRGRDDIELPDGPSLSGPRTPVGKLDLITSRSDNS
jgi:peptidoglycan/LPS O-acetylase OafA/YrhL